MLSQNDENKDVNFTETQQQRNIISSSSRLSPDKLIFTEQTAERVNVNLNMSKLYGGHRSEHPVCPVRSCWGQSVKKFCSVAADINLPQNKS